MTENERPNIVFINTDQQRYDTIGALGFDYADTPNLDTLVAEGVNFSGCYANSPVCGPTRAALFSGMSPHASGKLHNGARWDDCWIRDLAQSGYHCVNVGKMHTQPMDEKFGFHERYVVENKDRSQIPAKFLDELDKAILAHNLEKPGGNTYSRDVPDYEQNLGAYEWPLPAHLHPDNFVGDTALRWIDMASHEYRVKKPIFLEIGFPGPHPPYDPTGDDLDGMYGREYPLLPVTDEELASQPQELREFRSHQESFPYDSVWFDAKASDERRQRLWAYYNANMRMIDRKIGEIMSALRSNGFLENAVVIFSSDHGDNLGDHGLSQKWNMYEQSVHVPLVVWSSGLFPGGREVSDLYSWFDIGATVLELAGLSVPKHFEAISLLPALRDELGAKGRKVVFSEVARDQVMQTVEYCVMARDHEWKYIEYLGDDLGQLFSMTQDPNELVNLWNDSNYADVRDKYAKAVHSWIIRSDIHASLRFAGPGIRSDLFDD